MPGQNHRRAAGPVYLVLGSVDSSASDLGNIMRILVVLLCLTATSCQDGVTPKTDHAPICKNISNVQYSKKPAENVFKYEYMFNETIHITKMLYEIQKCSVDRILLEAPLNITYVDTQDNLGLVKPVFDQMLQDANPFLQLAFMKPILTNRLWINTTVDIQCAHTLFIYCRLQDICNATSCLNGGTCVGHNMCQCPPGFVGELCGQTLADVKTELDMAFLEIVGQTVVTQSVNFTLSGQVELRNSVGNPIRRNNHHGNQCHIQGPHGGNLHCHDQHVHNCFTNMNGFTHTTTLTFGHDHHHGHTTHLYNTHTSPHDHHSHGVSLSYHDYHLHMHVHNQHQPGHDHHHTVTVPFNPTQNQPNTITSTFSPHGGCSIFAHGHHLGSSGPPAVKPAPSTPPSSSTMCTGNCVPSTASGTNNYFLSNTQLTNLNAAIMSLNNLLTNVFTHTTTTTKATKATTTPTTTTPTTTTPTTTTTSTTTPTTTTTSTTQPSTTTAASRLVCYNCQNNASPGNCSIVNTCAAGEVCALLEDPLGFTHECMDAQVCNFGKKYSPKSCFKCCTQDVCNLHCTP